MIPQLSNPLPSPCTDSAIQATTVVNDTVTYFLSVLEYLRSRPEEP
jgi:hypothetical protein